MTTEDSSSDSLLRAIARSPSLTPPGVERDARVGMTIRGKYTLERVLGEGGMAIVYEGRHRNGKRFAVKILRRRLSDSDEARARFVREGYVANRVGHPGAVAILDDDVTEDDEAFIVMELLDGWPLDRVKRASPAAVLALGAQVCEVLASAHEQGIIHRDIKPQNLFVTRTGEVKVLDFGVARLREGPAAIDTTQSGGLIGTPAFMSPEQALGKTNDVDATSDLWALGATLFVLLGGRTVHEGESSQEVAVKAATQPAPRIATIAPSTPAALARVIDTALAFSKSERFPSARAMHEALVGAYRDTFGGTPSATDLVAMLETRESTRGTPRRRKVVWPLVLLAALGCVAGAIGVGRRHEPFPSPRLNESATPIVAASSATSVAVASIASAASVPATVSTPHVPAVRVKNCDPPFTVEASGKRIPKLECL